MQQAVSKSQFKAQLLEYLRIVEKKKQPLTITHAGKPVAKVIPFQEKSLRDTLRGSIAYYKNPTDPVGQGDWEGLK